MTTYMLDSRAERSGMERSAQLGVRRMREMR